LNSALWSRRRVAAGVILAAGTAGSMTLLSAVAPAQGSTSPAPKVAVAQGVTMAGLKAQPVFPVAPGTKETVSFALRMRDESRLAAKVTAGIRPGHFLSVAQFAERYGQSESSIKALEGFLADYGIKTKAYADHLVVTATGTAGEFDNALSVSQHQYKTAAVRAHDGIAGHPAYTFHGTKDRPLLPRKLARIVQSILGLTNYPIFGSSAVHAQTAKPGRQTAGLQVGNRTPENFAKDYGVTPLYAKGAIGQGQTIGIVTFASIRPADPAYFWSKVLHIKTKANRLSLDNVDGGSGAVSAAAGSGETTLDVEQSGAIAPAANIVVYQAPNSDYGSEDAYAAVASQNRAQTVSCSWGESETYLQVTAAAGAESSTLIQADDALFLELAAQGQSSFSTSGDQAAYDATGDIGTTNLSIDNAGDSPYTTSDGATTLSGTIPLLNLIDQNAPLTDVTIPSERAWGWDWQWPYYSLFPSNSAGTTPFTSEGAFAITDVVGSGGGYSAVEHRPSYQREIPGLGDYSAVPYLTSTDYQNQMGTNISLPTEFSAWDATSNSSVPPAVITGSATGRAEPDLSADGDPYTGYEEYFVGFPAEDNHIEDGWGGTSFVAPEMNGSAAVVDSYLGHRVGFWNPFIYRFAQQQNSPFTPIDTTGGTNTNIYYTGTAGAIYNPGTGLGTPNVAKIAADFRRIG
jgi:subtilase family serine protease